MGKIYSSIDDRLRKFIEMQHVFFVGTAPAGIAGNVNISPKGLDTFRILAPNEVAYIDFVGSGVETIAHLRENARIVIMLCAFDGPPQIIRMHGRGEVIEPQDERFRSLLRNFNPASGVRAIIRIDITRISDSCGYAVPRYRYEGPRTQLGSWAERKGEQALATYQREKNAASIDGLPALRWVETALKTEG
jgi:hypothetical protein